MLKRTVFFNKTTEESRLEEFREKIIEAVMTSQQASLTSFIEGIQQLIHRLQEQVHRQVIGETVLSKYGDGLELRNY